MFTKFVCLFHIFFLFLFRLLFIISSNYYVIIIIQFIFKIFTVSPQPSLWYYSNDIQKICSQTPSVFFTISFSFFFFSDGSDSYKSLLFDDKLVKSRHLRKQISIQIPLKKHLCHLQTRKLYIGQVHFRRINYQLPTCHTHTRHCKKKKKTL